MVTINMLDVNIYTLLHVSFVSMKHLWQDDALQIQVLYFYLLKIFPEFLVGNVLLHKERLFEMEESYKYGLFLFNVGYVQTVGRSQWPRGLRSSSAAAHQLRLWVQIPQGSWMFLWVLCVVR
jgi:hypothetical protein